LLCRIIFRRSDGLRSLICIEGLEVTAQKVFSADKLMLEGFVIFAAVDGKLEMDQYEHKLYPHTFPYIIRE
jgi:hypothetical protein